MNNLIVFADGPAAGQILYCGRTPYLLRVVNLGGVWDALDQIDDVAKADERIYLYRATGLPFTKERACRAVTAVEYGLLPLQPKGKTLRDNARFTEWCEQHKDEFLKDWYDLRRQSQMT